VSILDVGAGPITGIGFHYPGKDLALTAVYPLAGEYDRILSAHGLEPPVRTHPLRGQDLLWRFALDSFDVELGDGVEVRCTRDQFIGYEWICCTIRKR
jgi:hypothetical protein